MVDLVACVSRMRIPTEAIRLGSPRSTPAADGRVPWLGGMASRLHEPGDRHGAAIGPRDQV